MRKLQSVAAFFKKPGFILILILLAFFLKGVFTAAIFPIFTGQDESRHYNSIQSLTEPKEKNWEMTARAHIADKETFRDYNFSQEILEAGMAMDIDRVRHEGFNTADFAAGYDGQNETLINSRPWQPYNYLDPPDTAGHSLYHTLGSKIEKTFAGGGIFVRFFLIRVFGVFLATLAVLFTYFITKNSGFREKESLIIAAIVSMQPKFSMYSTNINYDALLIPAFFLFTLGAVLALRNGLAWKNTAAMLIAIATGLLTKGTALVMLAIFILLIGYLFHQKIKDRKNVWLYYSSAFLGLLAILFLVSRFTSYNLARIILPEDGISQTFSSIRNYLNESLTMGRFALSSRTYWGALTWGNGWVAENFTNVIKFIETFSSAGLVLFFVSKKPDWLPEKKYIAFFVLMIAALQLGIRFFDWKVFINTGALDLGTPGRYFLPNLASHIILVFVGIGAFFRREKYFQHTLILGLLLMFAFSMYTIFNIVIPRTYL